MYGLDYDAKISDESVGIVVRGLERMVGPREKSLVGIVHSDLLRTVHG